MIWLAIIWGVAALLGYAVHALYAPALSLAVSAARIADPGLALWLMEIGGWPALRDVLAWGTALVVGGVLTLVWLAVRVLGRTARAVRGDGTPPGFDEAASRRPASTRPESWQIDTRASPAPGPEPREPGIEPAREADRPGETQRWGRQ